MIVNTAKFGNLPDGREVKLFTFKTLNGLIICITNYGGIVTSIKTPDKNGISEEITAGFDNLDQYIKGHPHFGVVVGRFANRIAKGRFTLNSINYKLPINNGPNHLHGGDNGFHTKLWDYQVEENEDRASLKLKYSSPNMEEGYPGNVEVNVIYTVHDNNTLDINFEASTDSPTHINLTTHGYYNLSGFKTDITGHLLKLDSTTYVEIDETHIPTGKIKSCTGSPFDFTETKLLGKGIEAIPGGIDHCFALSHPRKFEQPAAELIDQESGRTLTIHTTQPGVQIYTGNSLDGSLKGHNGTVYNKHWAVCLETQHFPDSPNQPKFPSTQLNPGKKYNHKTKIVFGVKPNEV
jgi:aldose 1-epimerase